jgi:hypothetical protein
LQLRNALPCDFIPSVGALGYFKWEPADASIVPPPARWMIGAPAQRPVDTDVPLPQADNRCARTMELFA